MNRADIQYEQTAEIQRLFRIAERGMKVRYEQGSSSK